MTVAQASTRLGLAQSSVRQLLASRRLGHYRIGPNGGRIDITEAQLDAYLASCEVVPTTSRKDPASSPKPRREPLVRDFDHFGWGAERGRDHFGRLKSQKPEAGPKE